MAADVEKSGSISWQATPVVNTNLSVGPDGRTVGLSEFDDVAGVWSEKKANSIEEKLTGKIKEEQPQKDSAPQKSEPKEEFNPSRTTQKFEEIFVSNQSKQQKGLACLDLLSTMTKAEIDATAFAYNRNHAAGFEETVKDTGPYISQALTILLRDGVTEEDRNKGFGAVKAAYWLGTDLVFNERTEHAAELLTGISSLEEKERVEKALNEIGMKKGWLFYSRARNLEEAISNADDKYARAYLEESWKATKESFGKNEFPEQSYKKLLFAQLQYLCLGDGDDLGATFVDLQRTMNKLPLVYKEIVDDYKRMHNGDDPMAILKKRAENGEFNASEQIKIGG